MEGEQEGNSPHYEIVRTVMDPCNTKTLECFDAVASAFCIARSMSISTSNAWLHSQLQ